MRADPARALELDEIVRDETSRYLEERYGRRPSLAAGSRLEADLGLSSLDIAALVARLRERLERGSSPAVAHTDLRTFGDLCSAVGDAAGSVASDDPLSQARARAAARRRARTNGA